MSDQIERISADLQAIGQRVQALKDPSSLAGAQAELERRLDLLETQLWNLTVEVQDLPKKIEETLIKAFKERPA